MSTITKRDVIAFIIGAASATVVIAMFFGLFGVQMNRTFVPQPTFAAQPTFADQPTFLPQPTFLIQPSLTSTNTATPTKTPTSTPTNTPTITPTKTATMTRTLGVGTGTATANGTPSSTPTAIAVNTQTITCSNKDQDVEYTVKGQLTGKLTCAEGLTRQDVPVKTLVIPGAFGNINVTLDRVGGPDAKYAVLIANIPGMYGSATSTMTGTSIAEGHATITTNGTTLNRVQDNEVVTLTLTFGEFEVTAKGWLK